MSFKANDFYKHFGADVKFELNALSAHPFPTDLPVSEDFKEFKSILARRKVDPSNKRYPWINNCGIDVAGKILNYILPKIDLKKPELESRSLEW